MALADLYVLDLKQSFLTQEIHNIFSFENTGAATSTDLNNAFMEDLLPLINAVQAEFIVNVSLDTKCLGNLGDNNFLPLSGVGALAGSDMLPLHDAVNFTLKPAIRTVRPGSKRFSGIPEVEQVNGTITNAGYITNLNLLKIGLSAFISDDDLEFFSPVIIKRVKYVVPDSDPERFAYRFPEIGETPVYSPVGGVLLNLHISHQISRA